MTIPAANGHSIGFLCWDEVVNEPVSNSGRGDCRRHGRWVSCCVVVISKPWKILQYVSLPTSHDGVTNEQGGRVLCASIWLGIVSTGIECKISEMGYSDLSFV